MAVLLLSVLLAGSPQAAAATTGLDPARIEKLTGAKGAFDAKEGVFKVSVPRADLAVRAAGVRITPPMGLTSWAAFKQTGERTVVMGDLVLLEDQVNPVMSAALDAGLEVTALHNHFFWDTPKMMFMHIAGTGEEGVLASAVGKTFARMADTAGGRGEVPRAEIDPARTTLDPAKIDSVLGVKGSLAAGVYKVVIGRTARMHGHDMAAAMGVNTWAAFAGSDGEAVVDGDVAMLESELQGVLKALRRAGISVVAIHHHMTHEEPRILFLHYWGVGPTEVLAKGLRTALDETRHDVATRTTVVFVCEHGSAKSLVAASLFDRMAKERGLNARAVSRGTAPDEAVPPAVARALSGDGFDVATFRPRVLSEDDLRGAAHTVTMGVEIGDVAAKAGASVSRWDDIPPVSTSYAAARAALSSRLEALLRELEAEAGKRP